MDLKTGSGYQPHADWAKTTLGHHDVDVPEIASGVAVDSSGNLFRLTPDEQARKALYRPAPLTGGPTVVPFESADGMRVDSEGNLFRPAPGPASALLAAPVLAATTPIREALEAEAAPRSAPAHAGLPPVALPMAGPVTQGLGGTGDDEVGGRTLALPAAGVAHVAQAEEAGAGLGPSVRADGALLVSPSSVPEAEPAQGLAPPSTPTEAAGRQAQMGLGSGTAGHLAAPPTQALGRSDGVDVAAPNVAKLSPCPAPSGVPLQADPGTGRTLQASAGQSMGPIIQELIETGALTRAQEGQACRHTGRDATSKAMQQAGPDAIVLAHGVVGQSYRATIAPVGGVLADCFSITAGRLPQGLAANMMGDGRILVSGTPQQPESVQFTLATTGTAWPRAGAWSRASLTVATFTQSYRMAVLGEVSPSLPAGAQDARPAEAGAQPARTDSRVSAAGVLSTHTFVVGEHDEALSADELAKAVTMLQIPDGATHITISTVRGQATVSWMAPPNKPRAQASAAVGGMHAPDGGPMAVPPVAGTTVTSAVSHEVANTSSPVHLSAAPVPAPAMPMTRSTPTSVAVPEADKAREASGDGAAGAAIAAAQPEIRPLAAGVLGEAWLAQVKAARLALVQTSAAGTPWSAPVPTPTPVPLPVLDVLATAPRVAPTQPHGAIPAAQASEPDGALPPDNAPVAMAAMASAAGTPTAGSEALPLAPALPEVSAAAPREASAASEAPEAPEAPSRAPASPRGMAAAEPQDAAPAHLPDAQVGQRYSARIKPTGGTAPYRFVIANGALPLGLSVAMSDDGERILITGTPRRAEVATFTIAISDSAMLDNGEPLTGVAQLCRIQVVRVPEALGTPVFTPAHPDKSLLGLVHRYFGKA